MFLKIKTLKKITNTMVVMENKYNFLLNLFTHTVLCKSYKRWWYTLFFIQFLPVFFVNLSLKICIYLCFVRFDVKYFSMFSLYEKITNNKNDQGRDSDDGGQNPAILAGIWHSGQILATLVGTLPMPPNSG